MRSYRPGCATHRARLLALLAVLLALTGCTFEWQFEEPAQPTLTSVGQGDVPAGTLDPSAASAALADLRIAEKTPLDGYERGCGEGEGCVFGPAWADVDRNGCDQRNDVLHRDLTDVQVREGTQGCVVVAGVLDDPYTGAVRPVRQGRRRPSCRSTTSSRWPPPGCRARRSGRRSSARTSPTTSPT